MYTFELGVLPESTRAFNTPSSLAKSMFFYVLCAGYFKCDARYHIKRNTYNSYLLMYVLEGNGKLEYENKTYSLSKGDTALVNCYKKHSYSASGWEILWIHFDGNVSDKYFSTLFERAGCIFPAQPDDFMIKETMEKLVDAYRSSSAPHECIVSCEIERILAQLYVVSSNYNMPSKENSPVNKAISFMKDHFKTKLYIEQIADHCLLSKYHFTRLFKKETGYSPYEYITLLRINESKYLLKNSALLIKEIAFEVGFSSEVSFVTSFKDNTGYTPSEFRHLPI